jgi:hypothetical protein
MMSTLHAVLCPNRCAGHASQLRLMLERLRLAAVEQRAKAQTGEQGDQKQAGCFRCKCIRVLAVPMQQLMVMLAAAYLYPARNMCLVQHSHNCS